MRRDLMLGLLTMGLSRSGVKSAECGEREKRICTNASISRMIDDVLMVHLVKLMILIIDNMIKSCEE